jgi:translation initiation factor 2 gamma subunit (eIF-2gamma)
MQRLIVVLNKVDLIPESEREATLSKKIEVLRKMFAKTKFGSNVPIVAVSANPPSNINGLVELLVQQTERPNRILK